MATKQRLDQSLVSRGLVATRSQAETYIKLGYVTVNHKTVAKSGALVSQSDTIKLTAVEQYVSRAALKLASVTEKLGINFKDKVVLDVGSSTGGFTDYVLKHGAQQVIAVEAGTDQLHPSLRGNPKIELHERTDIRDVHELSTNPDIIIIDVSFISLQDILPHISRLAMPKTVVLAMAKPQFEAEKSSLKHKGVIKNDKIRREVLQHLESWIQNLFIVVDKADSEVTGFKGNRERFYMLKKTARP